MIRYKNQLKQRQGREEVGPAYCLRNVELPGDLEGIQSQGSQEAQNQRTRTSAPGGFPSWASLENMGNFLNLHGFCIEGTERSRRKELQNQPLFSQRF